jgi:hypothetical protein
LVSHQVIQRHRSGAGTKDMTSGPSDTQEIAVALLLVRHACQLQGRAKPDTNRYRFGWERSKLQSLT